MVRQLTKIFKLLTFLVITALLQSSTAQADSRVNELQYIKTYDTEVDGRSVFRIEVGLKRENINYNVKIPASLSSTMIIDFDNTLPGRLVQQRSGKIFLSGKETVTIKEVKVNLSRVQMRLPFLVRDDGYKVNVEKKPYRLIIDIYKNEIRKFGDYATDDDANIGRGSIVIDAGHGGSDSGAVGAYGVREKDVTLSVALKVQNLLKNSGATVVMTRTTDRDVAWPDASNGQELQARVNKTPPGAAVFVSIHCNAFSNPATNGMETYYYWGSAEGQRLASILNEELANFGGRANRGVKGSNFYVLKHSTVSAASLVELAFVTNSEEAYLLADNDYQDQLALAITRGIKRYLKINPNGNFND